jgi:transposase
MSGLGVLEHRRDLGQAPVEMRDRAGRIPTRPDALELFAQSLDARDRVALKVTGNAWAIAGILEPHVARVIVVSAGDTGIRQARARTDRLDARALASCCGRAS